MFYRLCFLFDCKATEIVSRNGKSTLQSVTKIDLGAQSQLLAAPGSTVQIHYEITNLREVPSLHYFQVVDDQRFLRTLNPLTWVWFCIKNSKILLKKVAC